MERLIIFISNFWCFLWHWLILVIPVRFLFPNEPSWLGADWYALLAEYEWGVPLTVFGFISFVMASQYIEFNGFPLVSLLRGRGLTKSFRTDVEDFLGGLAESEEEEPKKEERSGGMRRSQRSQRSLVRSHSLRVFPLSQTRIRKRVL